MNHSPEDLAPLSEPTAQPLALNQEHYWQEHIDCWAQSGLSQSAYCQREGLILHRWHYWHKKLTREPTELPSKNNDFISVKVVPQSLEQGLRVTLPNGIRIDGVNQQTVALLSAVLKQL